ncbi:MAG TPA: Flp pilus assembly protein CpaB [Pseudolabrys sp.]|jgi:pilus assembly protein CpaB|nr:Flp pilus assembly protein CpaB [Pseudolabrys sp.]
MRASTLVMIGFAVVFGLLAVFIAQSWLSNQAAMQARNQQPERATPTQTIVVAKEPLRYGAELNASMLKEVDWSGDALPAGAFHKVGDLLKGGRRIVLAAIEANEPVLALKVTGPGQRATLSALVGDGMKAVTIRVNDVEGVGGFVLPGDHVDVVLTRNKSGTAPTSEIVLQNTRVLAVDQSADQRATKAAVSKSVTLEVSTVDAQKVWLAASVGNLSLLLRKAGETAEVKTRQISLKDLAGQVLGTADSGDTATVVVTRGSARQDYKVPVESRLATVGAGSKDVR